MQRHLVRWKPVWSKNIYGKTYLNPHLPEILAESYRGKLVTEILHMPQGNPISFEQAANLIQEETLKAFRSGQVGYQPGQVLWYYHNFVKWISGQGYHIELTGDEFEPATICEHLV